MKDKDLKEKEKNLEDEILEEIESNVIADDTKFLCKYWEEVKHFQNIIKDIRLNDLLNDAYLSASKDKFINRHGRFHGLKVARYGLELFKLIDDGIIESSFLRYSTNSNKEINEDEKKRIKGNILLSILIAGYIHDIGRFFSEEEDHRVLIASGLKRIGELIGGAIEKYDRMERWIEELCLCHEKKDRPSDKVEVAMIKLADALDCDKDRCCTEIEKEEFKKKDEREIRRIIFEKDKFPEKYFGCDSVEKVNIAYSREKGTVEVHFDIKDNCAFVPLGKIRRTLGVIKRSDKEAVKKLAEDVTLEVNDLNKKNKYRLYPYDPYDIIKMKGIKFEELNIEWEIINKDHPKSQDVLNFSDVSFRVDSIIRNVSPYEIRSFMWTFYADEPISEKNNEIKIEEAVEDDKDTPKETKLEFPENIEQKEKKHTYQIIFKEPIKKDGTKKITLKGYVKKFFLKKEFFHNFSTPADYFCVKLKFPKEVKKENISSVKFIVVDEKGTSILEKEIIDEVREKEGKIVIELKLNKLNKLGSRYYIKWSK